MHPRHLGAPLLVLCLALACSVAAKQAREFTGELFVGLGVVAAGLLAAIGARAAQSEEAVERRKADLAGATTSVDEVAPRLVDGAARLARASEEHAAHARDLAAALAAIGPKVDALAARAAEAGKALAEIDPSGDAGAPALAELGAIAREATTAAGEAAAAVREVARRVEALGRSADEASASTVALGGAIDRLHASADETARLSEQVAADAEKGAEAIEQTLAEIVRIKDSSLEAATVIASLGTRIDAVGQILAVIDDVAEQTNLLALNAAIIAAQAGEHGKGFAVVADEIKDLAERAGGSTKEISDLVKTIQAESRNATVAATRGARDVERGVEVSADAERALGKIVDSARRSTQMARAIARALAEQAQGSKQVGDAASRVAEGAHQVANAVAQEARAADAVAKGVERLRGAAQAVERSSAEHARGVRAASEAIGEVSVVAQAIDAARRADAREADRALESARRAEELARANEDAARRVAAASERLRRAVSG